MLSLKPDVKVVCHSNV